MSLIDIVAEKYGSSVRGSKGSKRSESHPKDPKDLKEPRPTTDHELREILEGDWEEVSNDPAQLEAARYLVATAQKIEAGIVPDGYTKVTNCKYCGPVFVYRSFPQTETQSCPWCRNRYKGLPIPKGKTT